eukprot:6824818-Pyramimonas_sp.AAC.2
MVARIGTVNTHERCSRNTNYFNLEAWEVPAFPVSKYYLGYEVVKHPFVKASSGSIAYAADRSVELPIQPVEELQNVITQIQDGRLVSNLLGATGLSAMFVNGAGMLPPPSHLLCD